MDRVYEDDKTLVLAKDHGFNTVVPPKKNRKFMINTFINNAIISNDIPSD